MSVKTENMSSNEVLRSLYSKKIDAYEQSGMTILTSHFGELEAEEVNNIGFDAENKMRDAGIKKGVIKRVFSILVEALQNIRLHGERDNTNYQGNYMVVGQSADVFRITTANIILNKNIEKVEPKIIHINDMNEEELKEFYMQVLTNGEISNKGGAGLGFITIAMKSKNKLKYVFTPLEDDKSLFELESFVTIEQKD